MTSIPNLPFLAAVHESFGKKPWLFSEATKKAKPKNAAAELLQKAKSDVRVADLKNIVYELWEAGALELIPPHNRETKYRLRLTQSGLKLFENGDDLILNAYKEIKAETKIRHVFFDELARRSGKSIDEVHSWALEQAQTGNAELSEGDLSHAFDTQRKACFKHNGKNFLLVGLLNQA